jgi:hypothetical protein
MQEIGEEFVRLREGARAGAWSDLQKRLMTHMGDLVPDATSLKDFLGLAIDIENFLKTEQGSNSMHPMEALEAFLNTDDSPAPVDFPTEGRLQ